MAFFDFEGCFVTSLEVEALVFLVSRGSTFAGTLKPS